MIVPVQPLPSLARTTRLVRETGLRDPSALDDVGLLARETLGERVTAELRSLLVAGASRRAKSSRCAVSRKRSASR